MTAARNPLTLLTIPLELRELVYDLVFLPNKQINVITAPQYDDEEELQLSNNSTTWSVESGSWAMKSHKLNSQLFRVNRQLHAEALPFLYSRRTFDVTARDTLKILMHNIGPKNFSHIKHITIDWDELQQFAWNLKKLEYRTALSGLSCVQIAPWRHRHMYGTSLQWRNVKGRERSLLEAASEVVEQHEHLNVLAEHSFRRKSSTMSTQSENPTSHRVKWRFVVSESDLKEEEVAVDIKRDLLSLKGTQQEADDVEFSLPINDLI